MPTLFLFFGFFIEEFYFFIKEEKDYQRLHGDSDKEYFPKQRRRVSQEAYERKIYREQKRPYEQGRENRI